MASALTALAAAIDDLHDTCDDIAPGEAMLDEVRELHRQLARLESVFTRKLAALHRSGAAATQGFASTKAFLRHTCRISSGAARAHLDAGTELQQRPAVADDFATGEITFAHVKAITEGLAPLPEPMHADAEHLLLQVARDFDPARVHQAARRLRHIVDPDGQAGVDHKHYEDRWVDLAISYQGMGILRGVLDPESAVVVRTALDALATPAGDIDPRTPAQRRADALVDLAKNMLDSGELPEAGGERPHLSVAVDLATLTRERSVPAELSNGTHLGVDAARRLACDATVTRIVTTPATTAADLPAGFAATLTTQPPQRAKPPGQAAPPENRATPWQKPPVPPAFFDALPRQYLDALPPPLRGPSQALDVGRSSRTATTAIRKALAARDKGCVFPGCDRPPSRCEAHHVIHWTDGGITALHNMVLLCAFHHHYVHEYRWTIHIHDNGTVTVRPPNAQAA